MNDTYRRMMEQISLSAKAKQSIRFNLQKKNSPVKSSIFWKLATAVICLLLLIPITVLAVENVFGVVIINRIERVDDHDQAGIGVKIKLDSIENRPVKDFSEHLQLLDGTLEVTYDSWEAAEEDLGVDLLSNYTCADEKTKAIDYYVEGELVRNHCTGHYLGSNGQLYYAKICAIYERKQVKFSVTAVMTAEHPDMTTEELLAYHGSDTTYFQTFSPDVSTERYTTKNGIPVTICSVRLHDDYGIFTEYRSYFSVDNVTYRVQCIGKEGRWDDKAVYSVICEVLDGFAA